MRRKNMNGQGFCGRGNGQGYGTGNPLPYCRNNPMLPSRRAMAMVGMGNTSLNVRNEAEYLKNTAAYLKTQLETVNKRLSDLEPQA